MFHRDKTVVSSISLFSIMKSRLTLDFVDFDGNGSEPVIRIDLNPSDDVRDKFLKSLFQNSSGSMTIHWGHQEFEPNEDDKRSKIYLRKS